MKISVYPEGFWSQKLGKFVPSTKPSESIDIPEYVYRIKNRHWEDAVINVRSGRWQKVQAPGITPSGIFEYRNVKGLVAHSGILAIDIDAKDNPEVSIDQIAADPYVMVFHESISGNGGYVAFIKIDPERHLDAFFGLEKYFANEYKVIIDDSCKDVSRFRFVSFDENIYHNPNSKVFKKYIPKKKAVQQKTYIHTGDDMDFILQQIKDRGLNICEDYADWVKVGMGFANSLGESGRDKFHFISGFSTKYTDIETDKAYDGFLKRKRNDNSIASFFYLCQNQGIKIKTAKTEQIERIAKLRRKSAEKNGSLKDPRQGAINTLELSGIKKEESEKIIDQVMAMPDHEIENEKSDDLISDLKAFLTEFKMEFNEITRHIEINGKILDDRAYNSIYIKAKEVVSDKVTKDLLFSIMESEFTPEYNPFEKFFKKNKHLKPEGLINELTSCIEYKAELDDAHVNNYLDVFLKKWLLSVVASMHGTHSVMVLVLTGGQNLGKTKFFRGLLPEELQPYYAESKLDGKPEDDHALMCKKLIIMDDEFGGKSKQEAKKLKDLTAKDKFSIRKPYGKFHEDLKRLAVLCGTSNEEEVINDPTGNRRVIPVNVLSIDWERYDFIDKTALWMELYWLWKEIGENWMLTKEEIRFLNLITKGNEAPSIEAEAIQMFFDLPSKGGIRTFMTNTEILNYIETRTRLKVSPHKLGVNLKNLGFEKKPKKMDGVVKICYEVILKGSTSENASF
ncbi:MAG: Nonlabens phage [Bacteroidota bacterium]|jgi:uncharacterized protein Smg (DUF494 family)